jgi:hypothetical protein
VLINLKLISCKTTAKCLLPYLVLQLVMVATLGYELFLCCSAVLLCCAVVCCHVVVLLC